LKNNIKIGIEDYPFDGTKHNGAKVFLRRLSDSIIKQNLSEVNSVNKFFNDINIFVVDMSLKKSFISRLLNIKTILRLDGIYIDKMNYKTDTQLANEAIFSAVEKVNGVVFQSDFCKKLFEAFSPIRKKHNTIIHNGVDINAFNPQGLDKRSILGINDSTIIFITSAHWRRHKRLEETIQLFRFFKKNNVGEYKLIVLGGNPDFIVDDEDIIYIGEIKPDDLASWYRTGDIYLHLAWLEPAGNTQLEAMSCGLPVICSNTGGIGETIINANGGIVSKCDNIYDYKLVNRYEPPKPDYEILLNDIQTIIKNIDYYKNNIIRKSFDINEISIKYIDFAKRILA